mmetsp:Transcript_4230/g.4646  ORF Transcript_4230/g.4646 Transcript_4230/m.4646 type:complete len:306 (-) Transcript_4230:31-948(-)
MSSDDILTKPDLANLIEKCKQDKTFAPKNFVPNREKIKQSRAVSVRGRQKAVESAKYIQIPAPEEDRQVLADKLVVLLTCHRDNRTPKSKKKKKKDTKKEKKHDESVDVAPIVAVFDTQKLMDGKAVLIDSGNKGDDVASFKISPYDKYWMIQARFFGLAHNNNSEYALHIVRCTQRSDGVHCRYVFRQIYQVVTHRVKRNNNSSKKRKCTSSTTQNTQPSKKRRQDCKVTELPPTTSISFPGVIPLPPRTIDLDLSLDYSELDLDPFGSCPTSPVSSEGSLSDSLSYSEDIEYFVDNAFKVDLS